MKITIVLIIVLSHLFCVHLLAECIDVTSNVYADMRQSKQKSYFGHITNTYNKPVYCWFCFITAKGKQCGHAGRIMPGRDKGNMFHEKTDGDVNMIYYCVEDDKRTPGEPCDQKAFFFY